LPFLSDRIGGSQLGGFYSCYPWSDGLAGVGRSFEVFSSESWLLSSSSFLLPSRQLSSVIAHYRFVQDGQIRCIFCQAAAESLYSHKSGWPAPPPKRWCNSVLCPAHSPRRLAQWFATLPLREIGFSPYPVHRLWLLTPHPLSEIGSIHTQPLLIEVNYIHCLWHSVLFKGVQSTHKLHWIMLLRRVCGVLCSLVQFVHSQNQI
jgi:hypothetical protein